MYFYSQSYCDFIVARYYIDSFYIWSDVTTFFLDLYLDMLCILLFILFLFSFLLVIPVEFSLIRGNFYE